MLSILVRLQTRVIEGHVLNYNMLRPRLSHPDCLDLELRNRFNAVCYDWTSTEVEEDSCGLN